MIPNNLEECTIPSRSAVALKKVAKVLLILSFVLVGILFLLSLTNIYFVIVNDVYYGLSQAIIYSLIHLALVSPCLIIYRILVLIADWQNDVHIKTQLALYQAYLDTKTIPSEEPIENL